MNRCLKCNSINDSDAIFCTNCGSKMKTKPADTIIEPLLNDEGNKIETEPDETPKEPSLNDDALQTIQFNAQKKQSYLRLGCFSREHIFSWLIICFGAFWLEWLIVEDLIKNDINGIFKLLYIIEGCGLCTCGILLLMKKFDYITYLSGFIGSIAGSVFTTISILNSNIDLLHLIWLSIEGYLTFFFWVLMNHDSDESIELYGKRLVFRIRPECLDFPTEQELFSNDFFKRFTILARITQVLLVIIFIIFILIYVLGLFSASTIDESLSDSYFFFFIPLWVYFMIKIAVIFVSITLTLKKNILARYVLTLVAGLLMFDNVFALLYGYFNNFLPSILWIAISMVLLDIHNVKVK